MSEPKAEAKNRWRAEIEQSLAESNFSAAMTLIHKALAEFPDHPDFLELEEQVTHARDRSIQAYQLMEEGRQLCAEGNLKEGVQVLRDACALDPRNAAVRAALMDNLLCYSLAVLESNLALAERLWKEANDLDPNHPVNKSVAQSIREYKQLLAVERDQASPSPKAATPPSAPKTAAESSHPPAAPAAKPGTAAKTPPPLARAAGLRPPGTPPASPPPEIAPTPPVAQATPSLPAAGAPPPASAQRIAGSAAAPATHPPATATPAARERSQAPAAPPPADAPAKPTAVESRRPVKFPRWAWAAAGLAAIAVAAALFGLGLRRSEPAAARVSVVVRANPPEATVQINGTVYDISRPVSLPPGSYRIEAALEGYQPVVREVEVTPQVNTPIEITLLPVMPLVRISADLASGTVSLDGKALGELQNGQFAIASLTPGAHSLRISSGRLAEAVIPITVEPAGPPSFSGPIAAKEMRAVAISSANGQGVVVSSFGPAPLLLNGRPAGAIASEKPLPVSGLAPGTHEFAYGAGREQRKLAVDLGAAPGLFVSLNSDRNVGTLQIVSNEPGFELRINGRPARFATQRGRYLVYNLEAKPAVVQILKAGFTAEPSSQEVTIRKGEVVRASFTLTPIPTTATLLVRGALPGTRMSLDGIAHELQPNGGAQLTIAPGDHRVEFTRPGFKPKARQFSAQAGQTVVLAGNDVTLSDVITGKLTIASRSPASATVVLRRGATEIPVPAGEAEIPEGDYTLYASASGFRELSRTVRIAAESPVAVDIQLTRIPQVVRMEGWDDPNGWRMENGWYTRKGGNFVLFTGSSSSGTVQFTARHRGRQFPIFRGGQIRWVVNYADPRNYDLFELDGQRLTWKRIVNGQPGPQKQAPHGVRIQNDTYRLILDVGTGQGPGKIFDGTAWKPLPPLAISAGGRFGFYLP
ncbi:MAG TPA: PEGA domain-containing protein, partial [Terriglobia bacterium]|nr:PEGA domain-containing protein [Terriglobia bacterium]